MPSPSSSVLPIHDPHSTDAGDELLAAGCDARLLITAASSRQVEVVARRIHLASTRASGPFVHERARNLPFAGGPLRAACALLLDSAAGGSMLLSDVEEMSDAVQERLIGVLEDLERKRPSSETTRLVSGSSVSLLERVHAGTFSARLFYRLNVVHVVAGANPELAEG